ncbi:MAG TPA: 6-bladed beta-propeller [Burkholderiales bacterium]
MRSRSSVLLWPLAPLISCPTFSKSRAKARKLRYPSQERGSIGGTMDGRALIACVAVTAGLLAGCASGPGEIKKAEPPVFPPPPDEARFVFERSIYASGDVVTRDRNSLLRQTLTGESESGGEGVGKPYGVAVRQGKLYVADSVGGAVKVFDIPRGRYSTIGTGELRQPLGVDVDASGRVYVVDAGSKLVRVYDADGRSVAQIGGPEVFSRPAGIGVDSAGERVYVADAGGVDKPEEHRIRVFDARSGKHLFDFGKRGTAPGELNLPRDVTVAADGKLYVVDAGNFRIQVFDPQGKHLLTFGSVGRYFGNFARPRELALDAQGNVYVSDAAFGNFQIFDPEGRLLMFVGNRGERDEPARYMLPAGIAVDSDGRVYFADQYFRKIDVYRPASLKAGGGFASNSERAAK